MSAIRSMALLAGMAFCSAACAQQYGFIIFPTDAGGGRYASEMRVAQCGSYDPKKGGDAKVTCTLTQPKSEPFTKYTATQVPEVMTFIQISNPCWCRVDGQQLICIPLGCR